MAPGGSEASGRHGDVALLERHADLEPNLEAPGRARRLLRDFLDEVGRSDWADAGELAMSEVVTNAALHAHTRLEIHLLAYAHRACVEVRDFNPALPVARDYEAEATTGRGMGLVAAVSTECGIRSVADGKVVWFCVGEEPEGGADAFLATWDIDESSEAAPDGCVGVVLEAIPVTLWLSARQHHDAIIRELVLYQAEHGDLGVDIAAADEARGIISCALASAIAAARAAGTVRPALPAGHPSPLPWVPDDLDLHLLVPADIGPRFAALQDTLDVAERLAVDGELLIRPGLPEVIAARDWACEQVIAQLSGVAPAPWAGTAQERFETALHDRADLTADWDAATITTSNRSVVAADDANRIIAVSASFAQLVGWDPAELVGRRVVTVIPPSLREAHVAGFSRHLTTGEAHVLGVPLTLPVLCRDGREVICDFLVEQPSLGADRPVYFAWITPIASEP